ncbi:hypothetical protein ACF09L_11195 [Streptomyces sp. NPDC014779]|uniref:hypothetical protein n=1 Tax=Streptomyces sp. NPDC014779 TaxID=3364911 RepID=UPI0037010636
MVQLSPDELAAEFQEAVVELYFARKRIANLEAENTALRARLTTVPPQEMPVEMPAELAPAAVEHGPAADPAEAGGEQWFSGGQAPGEPGQ